MKPAGRSMFTAFRRALSAQAQVKRSGEAAASLPKQDAKITKLPNGMIVASVENNSPVSRVAVMYNAGSRHESTQNLGVTHCIRNASNLSTEKATNFGITRNIQQIGGSLDCTTTREHMMYTLGCLRSNIETGIEYLSHVAGNTSYLPWEMSDSVARIRLDKSMYAGNPHAQLMEALHKAAYRHTLGQSLYMEDSMLGHHTPEMCQKFLAEHYTTGNMAMVGLGVEHDQLVYLAKHSHFHEGPGHATESATYHGGDMRIETTSPFVQVAIATEGFGLASKDLIGLYVLQKVMGAGQYVKYGSNVATSKITKAAAQATSSPFAATCLNATYSDSGLFGFQVVAQAADVHPVLKSIMTLFGEATKGGITDADVKRAKVQLKAAVHMEMESQANQLDDLGFQALLSGQVLTPADIDAAIDNVSTADVQNIAKRVVNGKPSMAAVGNLCNTPYVDSIL